MTLSPSLLRGLPCRLLERDNAGCSAQNTDAAGFGGDDRQSSPDVNGPAANSGNALTDLSDLLEGGIFGKVYSGNLLVGWQ
jgi:hypothetical protein